MGPVVGNAVGETVGDVVVGGAVGDVVGDVVGDKVGEPIDDGGKKTKEVAKLLVSNAVDRTSFRRRCGGHGRGVGRQNH